jgi:hypothetical protein
MEAACASEMLPLECQNTQCSELRKVILVIKAMLILALTSLPLINKLISFLPLSCLSVKFQYKYRRLLVA